MLEGFKVAQKVIGRSAKKADSKVQLVEVDGRIELRASYPGLCYLTWTIPGTGKVPAAHLTAPLDSLRSIVERMPAEDISIKIDPKDANRLEIRCGRRSGKLPVVTELLPFVSVSKDAKVAHKGEMKGISPAIRQFNSVSLGGFNAWGCVCATPEGIGYATDEGNLIAVPFPVVEKASHPIMIPTQVLTSISPLSGDIQTKLTDNHLAIVNDRWSFIVSLTYVQAPNYKRVVGKFKDKKMAKIDLQVLTKEIRDFRKACKEGSLIVSVSGGKLKVRAARDAAIRYQSEAEIKESPDFDFTIIPENYLKVGPYFKKDVSVACVNGSHLFLNSGNSNGIISCHAGTLGFKQGVTREQTD